MKRTILAIIILLLSFAYGYAEVSQAQEAITRENQLKLEKRRQMDVKAAQYKADTGFKGSINYDLDAGVFEEIWGTFPNSDVRDTIAAQSKALLLINNLLPYIRIDIDQLSLRSIQTSDFGITVFFDQKIDSLKMEPHSGIGVVFRTKNFSEVNIISSLLPDLRFEKAKYLSHEEAQRIFDKEIGNNYIQRFEDELIISSDYSPEYSFLRKPEYYKICWRMPYSVGVSGDLQILYIDAVTGQILGDINKDYRKNISY